MFEVTNYGATGDGVTDDRQAIQDAIDDAGVSGGVVYFPKGNYLLDSAVSSNCLSVPSNVTLRGDGRGISILTLGNGVDGHIINIDGEDNVRVEGLELDGNRANQTAGVHGIRLDGDCTNLVFGELFIHDTFHYGIGIQVDTGRNIRIRDCDIEDTGGDGIDFKNYDDDSSDNSIVGVNVRRHGLNYASLGSVQAGIDVRGIVHLDNINVREFSTDQVGIRFREGEAGSASGLGGRYSTLTNFTVWASTTSGTTGVLVNDPQVSIGQGHVGGCGTGYKVNQMEGSLNGVYALSGGTGFDFTKDTNFPTLSDRTTASACFARNNTGTGFILRAKANALDNCHARSNNKGVEIMNGSDHAIATGSASSNSGGNVAIGGTATNVHNSVWTY